MKQREWSITPNPGTENCTCISVWMSIARRVSTCLPTPPSTHTTRMSLPTPDVFPFPYATPYAIQLQLMQHIYHTLEHSHLAIVQSPTGTVRPSSLLSSSFALLVFVF